MANLCIVAPFHVIDWIEAEVEGMLKKLDELTVDEAL
jgi:hypothetical protein